MNTQLTFTERQYLLHNKAARVLEQVIENKRIRKQFESDALINAFDNSMPGWMRKLHDECVSDSIKECDKHRADLLAEYAEIMETLVKPVIEKL